MHPTALDDQLVAAATDIETRLQAAAANATTTGVGHVGPRHRCEAVLVTVLAIQLNSGDVRLCEHLAAGPGPMMWSLGHEVLGCADCWTAQRQAAPPTSCDLCSATTDPDTGQTMFGAGPVAIVATLCPGCVSSPEAAAPVMGFDPAAPTGASPDTFAGALTKLVDAFQNTYEQQD